jgi:hypothetical protein
MWIRRLSELALAGCLCLAAVDAIAQPATSGPDDSLAAYRERFKQGMDLYEHGAPADAIAVWEPIFRDLGEQRGYRLAYDLGVAYAALDDAPRSAERLQSFVDEVDSRRARGEALGAAVSKEEFDARARLTRLVATLGRIKTAPATAPSSVRIDAGDPRAVGFVAWVTSGRHAVTFEPGTRDEQSVTVDVVAGAVVEVPPPTPTSPTSPAPAAPVVPDTPVAAAPASQGPDRRPPSPPSTGSTRAPFPPSLIAVAGGVTLAAAVAAIALELRANALRDRDVAEQGQSPDGTISAADRSSFSTTRTWAYVTVGGAAGFAALTAGLAGWYLLGRTRGDAASPKTTIAIRVQGPRAVLEARF